MLNQPHAVAGLKEYAPSRVQRRGVDGKQHRRAAAGPNPARRFLVWREVDMVPVHFLQALAPDGGQRGRRRTVVEHGGWNSRRKLQVNFHTVALLGTNA